MKLDPILSKFLKSSGSNKKIRKVFLFGSRARGTERPDSDYDLLLVVTPAFTQSDKDKLYDCVMDILLESGRLVSLKIFKEPVFKRLMNLGTPFMTHIKKEGIKIG